MLEMETNHSHQFKIEVGKILESPGFQINLLHLDTIKKQETWSRITRGEIDRDITRTYILPTVLLFTANSKIHEIESRLTKAAKSEDILVKNKEKHEAKEIIKKYCASIEYCDTYKNYEERHISEDWETAGDEMHLDEYIIFSRTQTLKFYHAETEKLVLCTPQEVADEQHKSGNERIKSISLMNLLNLFREKIKACSDQLIWDVERILAEDILDSLETDQSVISGEKKKPGRPPTKKEQTPDNKLITSYFSK